MKEKYKKSNKNNGATYICEYEVTWFTMYKRKVLTPLLQKRAEEVAKRVANEYGATLIRWNASDNFVTMRLSVPPEKAVHIVIKTAKGEMSRVLRRENAELKSRIPCLWSSGYLLNTVGQEQKKEDVDFFASNLPNSRVGGKKNANERVRVAGNGD